MDLYVGTSGYSHYRRRGAFYPWDLPEKRMLQWYGERFRTVEINISTTIHKYFSNWALKGVPAFRSIMTVKELVAKK